MFLTTKSTKRHEKKSERALTHGKAANALSDFFSCRFVLFVVKKTDLSLAVPAKQGRRSDNADHVLQTCSQGDRPDRQIFTLGIGQDHSFPGGFQTIPQGLVLLPEIVNLPLLLFIDRVQFPKVGRGYPERVQGSGL